MIWVVMVICLLLNKNIVFVNNKDIQKVCLFLIFKILKLTKITMKKIV